MRTHALTAAAVALALAASPADAAEPVALQAATELQFRLPSAEAVEFHGSVNFDKLGGSTYGMLYPAPSLLGGVLAVITHSALESSSQAQQKSAIRQSADKVLEPYAAVLRDFKHAELLQRALKKVDVGGQKTVIAPDAQRGGSLLVETRPEFSMTQDEAALILDNEIAVSVPGGSEPAYRNVVRVVSEPQQADNLSELWLAAGGEKLKDLSAALYAESVGIALEHAAGRIALSAEAPYRTVRFPEGNAERMERSQIVVRKCGRLLIRTLRDSLLSVPSRAECADGAK